MLNAGPLRVHLLQTESFLLDGGAMFGVIPKILWSKNIEADEKNRITLGTRPLLIQAGRRNLLVDAGIGDKGDAKFTRNYAVDGPHLLDALAAVSLRPDDITDVVLTHLHFDHCGGLSRFENGRSALLFPKAVFWLQKQAAESAQSPNPRERSSFLAENLEPIFASGRLNLVQGVHRLLENVELVPQFGHTDAMQMVRIGDGDQTWVYVCDLFPTAAHLRVPWVAAYDNLPALTMKEKELLLKEAVEKKWTLIYPHDAKIEASTVEFDGRHYGAAEVRRI